MTEAPTKPKLKLWPHPIEGAKPVPAFAVGDTTFYHWPNDMNLPVLRAHAGMDVYRELSFNVHKEDLHAYFAAERAIAQKLREMYQVRGGVFDIPKQLKLIEEFDTLTNEIEIRSKWISDFGLVFKLASVLYFDENEDPYGYDVVYASQVKIPRWSEAMDRGELPAFFFNQRIAGLLGFTDTSRLDTPTYTALLKELRETSNSGRLSLLQGLSDILSSTQGNSAEIFSLHSAMEMLSKQTA